LIKLRSYGVIFLLCTIVQAQVVIVPKATDTNSATLAVDVAVQKWLHSYLDWTQRHSEVMKDDSSGTPKQQLSLPMPYLEFFSPTGEPLYRGGNDERNAAFLHDLEHEIPSRSTITTKELRPTLKEYVEMLNELKPYQAQILGGKKFTVLAITYRDTAMCKAQNEAIRQFGTHSNIQVIELNLSYS
jgi:hypothetical protein